MLFTKYAKYSNRRFCPICKKHGKSEAEYTSHNTRDENDNPLCPILLDIVCNYCYQKGHIAAKCQSKPQYNSFVRETSLPPLQVHSPKQSTMFTSNSSLSQHSVLQSEDALQSANALSQDNFPALATKKTNSQTTPSFQYSNIAAIAKQPVKEPDKKTSKHWSPTCEEIESRLRKIVLADELKKEHANNIYGRTIYLTREQVRQKVNSGCDIDTDKVYVIDEYDDDYAYNDYNDPYECTEDMYDDDDDI